MSQCVFLHTHVRVQVTLHVQGRLHWGVPKPFRCVLSCLTPFQNILLVLCPDQVLNLFQGLVDLITFSKCVFHRKGLCCAEVVEFRSGLYVFCQMNMSTYSYARVVPPCLQSSSVLLVFASCHWNLWCSANHSFKFRMTWCQK